MEIKSSQKSVPIQDIPPQLLKKILSRIEQMREQSRIKKKILTASIVFLLTLLLLVPAWIGFQSDLMQNGFLSYVSLLFSDFNDVLFLWQDFSMSLIASFPLLSGGIMLLLIFCCLISLRYIMTHNVQQTLRSIFFKHHPV